MSFFGFGQSVEVEILLNDAESRKRAEHKTEDGKKEKYFLFYDGETVSGKVSLALKNPNKRLEHQGIKIEFIGQIGESTPGTPSPSADSRPGSRVIQGPAPARPVTVACQLQSEAWGSATSPARGRLPLRYCPPAKSDSAVPGRWGRRGREEAPCCASWDGCLAYGFSPLSPACTWLCFLSPGFLSEMLWP